MLVGTSLGWQFLNTTGYVMNALYLSLLVDELRLILSLSGTPEAVSAWLDDRFRQ